MKINKNLSPKVSPDSFGIRFKKDFRKNYSLYLIALPVIVFYIVFSYIPMYGAIIAFQNYSPARGITGSAWVGLEHFRKFFGSIYFGRVLKNTLRISILNIIFGFSAPIVLALMVNELKSRTYSKIVQTITYLPHFISLVVICGMIADFCDKNGIITQMLTLFGVSNQNLLNIPEYFTTIYVASDVWQTVGWGSIIYLAALMGIDPSLNEAAMVDGAGRWRQIWTVDIPCILPTIITLLVLRMGSVMSVGYEKVILLYNSLTMEKADVISSYVYRKGLLEANYGYSTAVGLFNSAINMILVVAANQISRKLTETSLW